MGALTGIILICTPLAYWFFVCRIADKYSDELEEPMLPPRGVKLAGKWDESVFHLQFDGDDMETGLTFGKVVGQVEVLSVIGQGEDLGVGIGDVVVAVNGDRVKGGDSDRVTRMIEDTDPDEQALIISFSRSFEMV